jgi:hypothetical protein
VCLGDRVRKYRLDLGVERRELGRLRCASPSGAQRGEARRYGIWIRSPRPPGEHVGELDLECSKAVAVGWERDHHRESFVA